MISGKRELHTEHLIYFSLLLMAFTLRFLSLGAIPPSDREAMRLLNVISASGNPSNFWTLAMAPDNLAYHNLSLPFVQALGDSNSVGRIISAIAGTALVAAAWLVRRRKGAVFTLTLTALLTFSPLALSLSRTAGSAITAALGLTLALLIYLDGSQFSSRDRAILIGIGLGLALTSGSSGITGLASLLLVLWFMRLFKLPRLNETALDLRTIGISMGMTSGLIATGFGLNWDGLSALGSSLGAWLWSWLHASSSGIGVQLLQLVAFEPLVGIFGLVGIGVIWKSSPDPVDQTASLWAASSLAINLARVGRQPEELIWIILPLVWVAARVLTMILIRRREQRWLQIVVLSSLLLVLAASANVSVLGYLQGFQISSLGSSGSILYIIFGALFLMAASLLLIFGMEWSWLVALDAFALAGAVILFSAMVQAAWRLNYNNRGGGARLVWDQGYVSPGMALMYSTLKNASLAVSGFPGEIDLQVLGEVPPALAWTLRDIQRDSGEFVLGSTPPAALLTPESQSEVQLLADYYGQTFELQQVPDWGGSLPPDIIRWWVLNEAPAASRHWVLWIRADIVGLGSTQEEAVP